MNEATPAEKEQSMEWLRQRARMAMNAYQPECRADAAAPDPLAKAHDPVNHPKHYTSHPSGVEVITITEHMNFCLGNAVKYILRADLKNDAIEDLKKAVWYINREIERRTK
jgi:hypothetical protein